jgi:hypothetical protein
VLRKRPGKVPALADRPSMMWVGCTRLCGVCVPGAIDCACVGSDNAPFWKLRTLRATYPGRIMGFGFRSAVSTAIALQRWPQPPKRRTAPACPRRRPERARLPGTARPDIPSPSPRRAPQLVPASHLKPQVRRTSRSEPCGTTPITSKAQSPCWSFTALANHRKATAPVIGEAGERLRRLCSPHSPTSPRGPDVPTRPNRNQDRSI